MRIQSSEIFKDNGDGTILIAKPIKIGGNYFNNVVFSRGVKIGEINLIDLVGKQLEGEMEGDVFVLTGYYE